MPMHDLILIRNNKTPLVGKLKQALITALSSAASTYPGLKSQDNEFNSDTEAALRAWQASVGLTADGIAGPCVCAALGVVKLPALSVSVTSALVSKLFPQTKVSNISRNLPYINAALAAFNLLSAEIIAVALGTIRAETESFLPISELPSKYNTPPGQPPFSAYNGRADLGNGPNDGALFRGRGYVQLTGRSNYQVFGKQLDLPLESAPDIACAPEIAACLLAAFINQHLSKMQAALAKQDLKAVRKIVNGGSHGLAKFTETYELAMQAWGASVQPIKFGATKARSKKSAPAAKEQTLGARPKNLRVAPDPFDSRDRFFMPQPHSLTEQFPPDTQIKSYLKNYVTADLILDQGQEGACTGYGLACVINYLRWRNAQAPSAGFTSVSPRMLYKFARRFDEYEGENYEGSSCRGAIKGWYYNGVCDEHSWPFKSASGLPKIHWEKNAQEITLGVYYRIDIKNITDLQAAIEQVGAIFVSAFTHEGWDNINPTKTTPNAHKAIPRIEYSGTPSRDAGHAFALMGFNRDGFIVQNSWGRGWGASGFAVLTYEDWLANAMDAWVVTLGVPGVLAGKIALGGNQTAAIAGRKSATWWNEERALLHSLILGNNGHVNHFLPKDTLTNSLIHQACVLPDTWFRETKQAKKRIVIYAHGGLNSKADAIKRAQAMGHYFLGNGCYPIFMVWKTGILESLGNIFRERGKPDPSLAGNAFTDATDSLLEKTLGRAVAKPIWSEIKENAKLAKAPGRGGDLLVDALRELAATAGKDKFEVHLVGHSAGAIFLGHLIENFAQKNALDLIKSTHLYAPACSVEFANHYYARHADIMARLHLDVLSDRCEHEDNVAVVYRKSLLYFVSNALEADARTPILGTANVFDANYKKWDGSISTSDALKQWRSAAEACKLAERLKICDAEKITYRRASIGANAVLKRPTHGGFDNDVEVIENTLRRIIGTANLTVPVDDLMGF